MRFQRTIEKDLIAWKNKPGRKPLVLQGVRQVGKTFLLKNLGSTAFQDTAYFNFEEQPDLRQFFESTRDTKQILQNLSIVHGREIHPENTLIIFDEIQECNAALNSLKYFQENAPSYALACAGSLLGVSLSKGGSFPVGKVDFLQVYPLTFMEFLAGADEQLFQFISAHQKTNPVPNIFFNPLLDKFRNYFICGGMPEPASVLLDTHNIAQTEIVIQNILRAYQLDFSKHIPASDIPRIGYIWNSIPAQLSKENKKFVYNVARPGARAREYENALLWLEQAGLILKVVRCVKPNIPISSYDDLSSFKIYLSDIGLLRSLARLDPSAITEKNKLFTEFKGSLTENYILQSLISQFDMQPRYWTSDYKAEVDFLIQYRNDVIPCEVKADENIRSKSLFIYSEKYHPPVRIRYSLKNFAFDDGLLNIPLFMADRTKELLEDMGL